MVIFNFGLTDLRTPLLPPHLCHALVLPPTPVARVRCGIARRSFQPFPAPGFTRPVLLGSLWATRGAGPLFGTRPPRGREESAFSPPSLSLGGAPLGTATPAARLSSQMGNRGSHRAPPGTFRSLVRLAAPRRALPLSRFLSRLLSSRPASRILSFYLSRRCEGFQEPYSSPCACCRSPLPPLPSLCLDHDYI